MEIDPFEFEVSRTPSSRKENGWAQVEIKTDAASANTQKNRSFNLFLEFSTPYHSDNSFSAINLTRIFLIASA